MGTDAGSCDRQFVSLTETDDFTLARYGWWFSCPNVFCVSGDWNFEEQGQLQTAVTQWHGERIQVGLIIASMDCDRELRMIGTWETDDGISQFQALPVRLTLQAAAILQTYRQTTSILRELY